MPVIGTSCVCAHNALKHAGAWACCVHLAVAAGGMEKPVTHRVPEGMRTHAPTHPPTKPFITVLSVASPLIGRLSLCTLQCSLCVLSVCALLECLHVIIYKTRAHSLTHSLARSLARSLAHSLNQSINHSHSITHSLNQSLAHPLTHSLARTSPLRPSAKQTIDCRHTCTHACNGRKSHQPPLYMLHLQHVPRTHKPRHDMVSMWPK